ncbi:MAG: exodeoxyribonuclease V subunit alpha [Kiritimatiellae bacterium]|nr:exodeoxyribonuclease V subunit alpha [Kiritimatiellia bacterium]
MKNRIRHLIERILPGNPALDRIAELCMEAAGEGGNGDVCTQINDNSDLEKLKSATSLISQGQESSLAPFILDGDLLYTRRNWKYEKSIAERLKILCESEENHSEEDKEKIKRELGNTKLNDVQKKAAYLMNTSRFSIITGGPGTGKTYTFAKAVKIARSINKEMKILFAAPTGKAAARMSESLSNSDLNETIPSATTLHKLIGVSPSRPKPKKAKDNPIDVDWLIVDESSMIDLSIMAKLLAALPENARLTLIGDANQLASVERGRVFGDLCAASWAQAKIIRLEESRRFEHGGEIDLFSRAINDGDGNRVLDIIKGVKDKLVYRVLGDNDFTSPSCWKNFKQLATESFGEFLSSKTPQEALSHINDFRVLTADRIGSFGCNKINEYLLKLFAASLDRPLKPIPIMITRNDNMLHVANGDIGVIMPSDPGIVNLPALDEMKEDKDSIRRIPLALLENEEIAFASTIHKSQGSEFDNVAIILGIKKDSPLLTREILYTGITRTRNKVYLYANDETVVQCCNCATARVSGLKR